MEEIPPLTVFNQQHWVLPVGHVAEHRHQVGMIGQRLHEVDLLHEIGSGNVIREGGKHLHRHITVLEFFCPGAGEYLGHGGISLDRCLEHVTERSGSELLVIINGQLITIQLPRVITEMFLIFSGEWPYLIRTGLPWALFGS